jgi:glycosyltransferase involved in cell wall biosynthesis
MEPRRKSKRRRAAGSGFRPLVSVVTATYNRSQVLRLAIASLLRSTFKDWELIVVGDACTDDTAEVVASFDDARVRFVNLPENCGDQSGPNNEGCRLAAGKYIAFLNHDDLWLPDHLETLLAVIEREKAELAFARGISVMPDGSTLILGAAPRGRYEPVADVHASLWLFRREMLAEVGPWRLSRSSRTPPSQDWLIRAWRLKKKMVPSDRFTVIAVQALYYPDCYKRRRSEVHDQLSASMESEPAFRERLLTRAVLDASARLKSIHVGRQAAALVRALVYGILLAARIPPVRVKYILKSLRRGDYQRKMQRKRGSPVHGPRKHGE